MLNWDANQLKTIKSAVQAVLNVQVHPTLMTKNVTSTTKPISKVIEFPKMKQILSAQHRVSVVEMIVHTK